MAEVAEPSDDLSTVRISKNAIGEAATDIQNVTIFLNVFEHQVKASLWAMTGTWWIRFNAPEAAAMCIEAGAAQGYTITMAEKNLDMNEPEVIGQKKPTLFIGRLGEGDNCAFITQALSGLPGGSFEVALHEAKVQQDGQVKDPYCFVSFIEEQLMNAAPLPIRIHI